MGKRIHPYDPAAGCCQPTRPKRLVEYVHEYEGLVILCVLEAHNWNKAEAARELGISKITMYKKCLLHNLHAPDPTERVIKALDRHGGSVWQAAKELQIGRHVIYEVARKHGRNLPSSRA